MPKQEEAIFSRSSNIGYGGAWGSGKTLALAIWVKCKTDIANNLILVGRKTYDELRDTTQREYFDLFPEHQIFHNKNENATYLPNGTTILWRHLDEWHKLTNLNLGAFAIDQAEEIAEECFIALQGRLRRNVNGRQSMIVFNTEGHNWIWKMFKAQLREDYHLIETTTFENPHLPDDYFERLKLLPDNIQKRYVFGSWAVFEGQIYEEFIESKHAINPFNIPESWEKIVAIDHGFTNPTAILWAAIDYDGKVFIYDEHYKANETISYHAEEVKKRGKVSVIYIDPSCVAKVIPKKGQLYSIIDEYSEYGIYPVLAVKDVFSGINRVKEYFKQDKLFIFKNCVNLLDEINQYQWKRLRPGEEKNEPDEPRKYRDHACDSLRYLIASHMNPSAEDTTPKAEPGSLQSILDYDKRYAESVDNFS